MRTNLQKEEFLKILSNKVLSILIINLKYVLIREILKNLHAQKSQIKINNCEKSKQLISISFRNEDIYLNYFKTFC